MFKNQRRTLDQKTLSGIIFYLHEEFFHWWLILFIISMLIFMCICLLFKARIVMADPEKYRDWFERNYTRVIGQALLCNCLLSTLKSWFNESRFNEIPRFSEQIPAPLDYFAIVNSIWFSELLYLVNKSGITGSFVKSRLGCTAIV